MKRDEYLATPRVGAFLRWAKPLVTGRCYLDHPAEDSRATFKTIADAQRCYNWARMDYDTTVTFLAGLRARVKESREANDPKAFRDAAADVLKWGGVSGRNTNRLEALAEEALPLLELNARLLDPRTADLERVWVVHPMNSGFSKIYSLMLDVFPIYDSRVACALGSLVRQFCEKEHLSRVPELLAFGIPPSRAKAEPSGADTGRDPSCGSIKFPKTDRSSLGLYARSNVMAAWVLDELSKYAPFVERGDRERQFALQSALFMIGHMPLRSCD